MSTVLRTFCLFDSVMQRGATGLYVIVSELDKIVLLIEI